MGLAFSKAEVLFIFLNSCFLLALLFPRAPLSTLDGEFLAEEMLLTGKEGTRGPTPLSKYQRLLKRLAGLFSGSLVAQPRSSRAEMMNPKARTSGGFLMIYCRVHLGLLSWLAMRPCKKTRWLMSKKSPCLVFSPSMVEVRSMDKIKSPCSPRECKHPGHSHAPPNRPNIGRAESDKTFIPPSSQTWVQKSSS